MDFLYCQSTPPIIGITGARLSKRKRIPFIYNIHDVFPDSLVGTGLIKEKSVVYKIGRIIEKYIYDHANTIVTISEGISRNLMSKGVPKEKIVTIENWIDEEKIKPVAKDDNYLFDTFNIDKNKFIVLYAGNLGKAQNIEVIINAAKLLHNRDDIRFVIIGNGSDENLYKQMVTDYNLANVMFYPMQPYEVVSEVYSLADVSIISCKKGLGNAAMPSKTWSILATGKPIVACFDADSDLRRLLSENELGLSNDPDDASALASNILMLFDDIKLRESMGKRAIEFVKKNKSKNIGIEQYSHLFEGRLSDGDKTSIQ